MMQFYLSSRWPAGTYLVRIEQEGQPAISKVIVKQERNPCLIQPDHENYRNFRPVPFVCAYLLY